MNDFPLIMGREPRATNVFLVSRPGLGRLHIGTVLNDAWRARMRIMAQDESVYDFVLLLRAERSYRRCATLQIRFLLYTLPYGFGAKVSHDEEGMQFLHDTYYLPRSYNLTWLDFSEKKYGDSPDFHKNLSPVGEKRKADISQVPTVA